MIPVTVLHEAEVELWAAVEYYEGQSRGLGFVFEAEVERSLLAISEFPKRWPLREDGTRRYLLQRFPYLVVYAVLNNQIWVIALAHCKRQPACWKERIDRATTL